MFRKHCRIQLLRPFLHRINTKMNLFHKVDFCNRPLISPFTFFLIAAKPTFFPYFFICIFHTKYFHVLFIHTSYNWLSKFLRFYHFYFPLDSYCIKVSIHFTTWIVQKPSLLKCNVITHSTISLYIEHKRGSLHYSWMIQCNTKSLLSITPLYTLMCTHSFLGVRPYTSTTQNSMLWVSRSALRASRLGFWGLGVGGKD
jgi:hypothetical protein